MPNRKRLEYGGLKALPGVQFVSFPALGRVVCPFCGNQNVGRLAGKISFAAKISGDDLLDDDTQPLAGFICPSSHIFFLREQDIVPAESLQ